MQLKIFIVLFAVLLAACSPSATNTDSDDLREYLEHITYGRDAKGIYYAFISTRRLSTSGSIAQNVIFTAVDCAKVGL